MCQKGAVIWLTGMSGAGKTTIAERLAYHLKLAGRACYVLDGDKIRSGLNSDLGYSPQDRKENIRRAGEVAAMLADAGLICIAAFISPYASDRQGARRAARQNPFFEVYVSTPLQICEARDPKGLHKKARAGTINDFTGIHAPYEIPENPDLVIDTEESTVDRCVDILYSNIMQHPIKMTPSL